MHCCWCPGKSEKRVFYRQLSEMWRNERYTMMLVDPDILHVLPAQKGGTSYSENSTCSMGSTSHSLHVYCAASLSSLSSSNIRMSKCRRHWAIPKLFFFLLLALRVTFLYLSVPYYCWVFPLGPDRTRISSKTERRNKYLWLFLAFRVEHASWRLTSGEEAESGNGLAWKQG